MEVTEVRIKLMRNRKDKLKAFCSVTFDNAFVVRDLKIIEGLKGIFVAMPSRKLTDRCSDCGTKNHLRANYCNECGNKLDSRKPLPPSAKLHADIAHPINSECRQLIQGEILERYREEVKKVFGEDIDLNKTSNADDEEYDSYDDDADDDEEEVMEEKSQEKEEKEEEEPREVVEEEKVEEEMEEVKSEMEEAKAQKESTPAQDEFGAGIFN